MTGYFEWMDVNKNCFICNKNSKTEMSHTKKQQNKNCKRRLLFSQFQPFKKEHTLMLAFIQDTILDIHNDTVGLNCATI